MLVFYEKETMKPTQESVDYACSVERHKTKATLADVCLSLVLGGAFIVILLDLFVWRP